MGVNSQQLNVSNLTEGMADALAARTKDPLWLLGMQWRTGAFAAEPGGSPTELRVRYHEHPITQVRRDNVTAPAQPDAPLDWVVEAEAADGSCATWRTRTLDHAFGLETAAHVLDAQGYPGRGLDWHHFDIAAHIAPPAGATPAAATEVVLLPSALAFRGAPDTRWWAWEDGDAYFDSPVDPNPNILSMMLPEFFLIDLNNWFLAPLTQKAGSVREILAVTITDSFGETLAVPAATSVEAASAWGVFVLTDQAPRTASAGGGEFLFVPNIALQVLDNEEIEEVVFLCDEEANLVWAIETLYRDAQGEPVRHGKAAPTAASAGAGTSVNPQFHFRSPIPAHWIPFVPRRLEIPAANNLPPSITTYLRRARTEEAASVQNPQYNSRIVGESWRIDQEQAPRAGTRVRRRRRAALGSNGELYTWIGRHRDTAGDVPTPGLRFDYLEGG